MAEVSHSQIYERLVKLEEKVDRIDDNTKGLVDAIDAAEGAVKVLGWIASLAKPILWCAALITAVGIAWQNFKSHL
jgi:hypothetical protein